MKKLSNTAKLTGLLLPVPVVVGAWMYLGPDGLGLIDGIHINRHGTGAATLIVYGVASLCLIGGSYYSEVIKPRRALRRKLRKDREDREAQELRDRQEEQDRQRKPVEYVYGPDTSSAAGSSHYDMAVIERYNRGAKRSK